MTTGARAIAALIPVLIALAVVEPSLGAAAGAFLVAATAGLHGRASAEASSLRRGWWVVALAALPPAALSAPGLVPATTRPALAVVTALLVVLAVILATPPRDPAEGRENLIEALLAGGIGAFLLASLPTVAVDATLSAPLVVVAAQTSALWLLLRYPGRLGSRGAGPAYLLAGGLTLLLARQVGGLLEIVSLDGRGAPALTVGALGLWALALAHPEAAALPAYRARGEQQLDTSRVLLVLVGVLVGPSAVTVHLWLGVRPAPGIALGGGVLALLSVLHLLQAVADRGRRAWRAQHDALTGLPSEPLFEDRLKQAMANARRSERGLAVAFVDLDGFKQVNDRDGHEAGDEVLREVARRLRDALREQDTVARKSGDEFLVLLPDVADELAAQIVAEKLLAALEAPIVVGEQAHRVGASIGLALGPRDGTTAEDLVRHADAAMYDTKDAGRGGVRWYSTTTSVRARLRLVLAQQLEDALGTAALELDHQPRVDLRDGTVVGLVSLVRWRHPDLGRLTPASFLPIAAEAGLAEDLDRHVLERACLQAGRWSRMGWLDVPVTVHLSDDHTADPGLEERVVRALTDGGLPPTRLRLAVTEDGLRRGGDRFARTVDDLAELGVGTVLTRFGAGDVGLGRLAGVRLRGVELHGSHVARLRDGHAPVVEAIVELGERLGLEVSGNGIDGEVEVDRLRGLGVRVGRGRHIGRPLLKHELDTRLVALAGKPGHRPDGLLAERLVPASGGSPGPEHPELAAAVRGILRHDGEVEEGALADLLRRVSHPHP